MFLSPFLHLGDQDVGRGGASLRPVLASPADVQLLWELRCFN